MNLDKASQAQPAENLARFLSYVVDAILIVGSSTLISVALGLPSPFELVAGNDGTPTRELFKSAGISLIISILYGTILESSAWQATVGKKIFKLVVTDDWENRPSIVRAFSRHFLKFLILALFPFGMGIVAITPTRRGVHDFLAGTRVYQRDNLTTSTDSDVVSTTDH